MQTAFVPPLPPRRPAELTPRAPLPPPVPPSPPLAQPTPPEPPAARAAPTETATPPVPPAPPTPVAGDDPETCAAILGSGKIVGEASSAIHAGLCGIEHPLMLKAVVLADKRQIKLEAPVAMTCRLAGAIADWVIEDLEPLTAKAGSPLAALSGVGAYECRGRNGVAGAKLSEHARGNAFDISALKLADGRMVSVARQNEQPVLLAAVRVTACARFTTVLGPGSDGYHQSHVHVDLEERRHSNRLCQWDFAPTPAPTPAAASPPAANAADAAKPAPSLPAPAPPEKELRAKKKK